MSGQRFPAGPFRYVTLILAVGSRANRLGTPGVAENCRFIDDAGEAHAFSNLLRGRLFQAINACADLHVVIVGDGSTGVELTQHVEILSSYAHGAMPTRLRMTLIETGPRLLGPSPERISRAAEANQTLLARASLPRTYGLHYDPARAGKGAW